jgi:hypothetical protein
MTISAPPPDQPLTAQGTIVGWVVEPDPGRIAQMLNDSAKAVRDAVKSRVEAGRDMNLHYDHPILCSSTCSGTRATITVR